MKQKMLGAVAVLALCSSAAMAHPISLNITGGFGLWTDTFGGNLLPAGAYYQVWWSSDQAYLAEPSVNESVATLSTGQNTSGDYVLASGSTPNLGGWGSPQSLGQLTDANVGGSTISDGYIYMFVYQDGTPQAGDSYVRTSIYGNAWGDPTAPQPPPPDSIPASSTTEDGVFGTYFVVPEPGTLALFGIGMLTIAARRRKRA